MTSPSWNKDAFLRCGNCCDQVPMGRSSLCGCGTWSEVGYEERVIGPGDHAQATQWLRRHRQVMTDGDELDLGQGNTPLVRLAALGPDLLLKDESANPTWSHKDRANATNATVARLASAPGMAAQTTGNHGASVAAFAAAAGLSSVILCRPGTPTELHAMIWAYGGIPVLAPPALNARALAALAAAGYYPATSLDLPELGSGNPYGAEAYKRVSWEIFDQLGAMPGAVVVPTASGDTFYGVTKGFAELATVTGMPAPLVIAVQPANANPLQRSADIGRLVEVEEPASLALSIANARTGGHALAALRRWPTLVVSVTESDIVRAVVDLNHAGHFLEPASAAALAGYRVARSARNVPDDKPSVLLGTASATKWISRQAGQLRQAPLTTLDELADELRQRDLAPITTA